MAAKKKSKKEVFEDTLERFGRRAKYTKTKVNLPYAAPSKYVVEPGDIVSYRHTSDGGARIGRVLGRVDADKLASDGFAAPAVVGFVAVLELSSSGQSCILQWVDPANIFDARTPDANAFIAWFFGATLPAEPLETIARHYRYGTLTENYIKKYTRADGTLPSDPNSIHNRADR